VLHALSVSVYLTQLEEKHVTLRCILTKFDSWIYKIQLNLEMYTNAFSTWTYKCWDVKTAGSKFQKRALRIMIITKSKKLLPHRELLKPLLVIAETLSGRYLLLLLLQILA
jgi:hypothetical protein